MSVAHEPQEDSMHAIPPAPPCRKEQTNSTMDILTITTRQMLLTRVMAQSHLLIALPQ
jgi:hypothetical protein